MSPQIISVGPPPLTDDAADAALDAIDFIAATVRGIDTIDVTPEMQVLWRQHLAACYPYLPLPARAWYASAPTLMTWIRTQWPYLSPDQQFWIQQQWAASLPSVLMLLEPVLRQAAEQLHPALAEVAQAMRSVPPPDPEPELSAVEQLRRHAVHAETLRTGSIAMANSTIDLIRAMSRH